MKIIRARRLAANAKTQVIGYVDLLFVLVDKENCPS